MELLIIDCCIRRDQSRTKRLLDRFLAQLKEMPVVLTNKSLRYIRFLRES